MIRTLQETLRHLTYSVLTLVAVAVSLPLAAQPLSGSSTVEQLLAAADSARVTYNWTVALENYDKAFEITEEEYLLPLMAQMNYELRDIASGIRLYTRAFRRTEAADTTYNLHRFYFGRMLKMDEQYDEAGRRALPSPKPTGARIQCRRRGCPA